MKNKYSIEWLTDSIENGHLFKYVYFWGHTNGTDKNINKNCLSQWFESPFTVDDITYKTAEHWMMAQKALLFDDRKIFDKIIESHKPGEAKDLGRHVNGFDEQVWDNNKYDIVKAGNIHKFNQHDHLANYLLNTYDRILVEASPVDRVWGVGLSHNDEDINNIYAWRGQNLLGFALMEVRDFLNDFGRFELLSNAMLPPWRLHPRKGTADMFWRMGQGEECITAFHKFYVGLNNSEKIIYQLSNPAYGQWTEFYD